MTWSGHLLKKILQNSKNILHHDVHEPLIDTIRSPFTKLA